MKKVTAVLFDDEIYMPISALEDGTKREPYEIPVGDCGLLSRREDNRKEEDSGHQDITPKL